MKTIFSMRRASLKVLAICVLLMFPIAGCGGLKMGVGLRGTLLDGNKMTLDGDTFFISGRLGDDMLVVHKCGDPDNPSPDYLLKLERNGFYYPQVKADDICTIDNTADYVCLDNTDVYDVKARKVLFALPHYEWGLGYLGKWKDRLLFACNDGYCCIFCFSDGKHMALQENVCYKETDEDGVLTLVDGAQKIKATFADLYDVASAPAPATDPSVEKLTRSYYLTKEDGVTQVNVGFGVDLEVPKGSTAADVAVRKWMMVAVTADAFWQLETVLDGPVPDVETLDDMKEALDRYGALWQTMFRSESPQLDSVQLRMTCDIKVRLVADCADYTTYHYWADLDGGGIHSLPHEYYITYDKRMGAMMDADNSVRPDRMKAFRKKVLRSMKKQYDDFYEKKSSWDGFTWNLFSFHCPSSLDTSGMSEATRSMLEHHYSCDGWSPSATLPCCRKASC